MSKRMTLIVGAKCSDGMFFCSDTEEGTMMGNKRSVKKLSNVPHKNWHLVFGAAGFGPLCDVAAKWISNAALNSGDKFMAEHEKVIGDELERLYHKYIPDSLPEWKRFDRQIALVVGILDRHNNQKYLYRTHEEIVQPMSEPFACAGMGEGIADYYLARLFRDFRPPMYSGQTPKVNEAEILLQFVMKEAKASVGSVGGNTDTINVMSDGTYSVGKFGAGWEGKQPNLNGLIEHFWLDAPSP